MGKDKKVVIVAPLDWGLGHATRCIPIIKKLYALHCKVVIVTSGRPLLLLRKEFPDAVFYDLPSYNIYYQKRGSFLIKLTIQLQKILAGIAREHRQLRAIIQKEQPDLIISDNRYGVRNKKVYSVFISHQMMIKFPGSRLIEWIVQLWLERRHRKFDAVWIPDAEGEPNLSGDLSHAPPLLPNTKFIGLLNRFEKDEPTTEPTNDILCILSGPEPQRSILETQLLQQARSIGRKMVIVQGVSEQKKDVWVNEHIRMVSHAHAKKLHQLILSSQIIISRGGYTTLMDLAPLGKRCIFIPTPGQTEQEYLVQALASKGMCVHMKQKHFKLASALQQVENIQPFYMSIPVNTFNAELESVLEKASQAKVP